MGGVCLRYGGEVELDGKRIAITHGHMRTDVRRLLTAHPDYLLTGHSHIRQDWRDGETRRINPGGLHDADEFSVALLDLETDEEQRVKDEPERQRREREPRKPHRTSRR